MFPVSCMGLYIYLVVSIFTDDVIKALGACSMEVDFSSVPYFSGFFLLLGQSLESFCFLCWDVVGLFMYFLLAWCPASWASLSRGGKGSMPRQLSGDKCCGRGKMRYPEFSHLNWNSRQPWMDRAPQRLWACRLQPPAAGAREGGSGGPAGQRPKQIVMLKEKIFMS